MTQPAVTFEGIHRAFDDRHVLAGLTFAVPAGAVYALLGRNGAGKTTAIRVALGLIAPMAGRSSVLGVDSRTLGGEVRDRIGYVCEGHRMEASRTIERTLDYERATRDRFDLGYARACLDRAGLSRNLPVAKLSRGQRAQVALILALAARPDLMLFDDPALGLDVVMRRELIDILIDLLAERETTVLLTSHVLPDVERLADHVGILHRGSLIVDAPREELRRRVERRFLRQPDQAPPSDLPGLLGCRPTLDGLELTLLDADDARLRAAYGDRISARQPASLEELFMVMTADDPRSIAARAEEVAA